MLSDARTKGMAYHYSYTPDGNLASKSASGRTLLAYTYTPNSKIAAIQDVTGRSTYYSYDAADRTKHIADETGKALASYSYGANQQLEKIVYGNGITSTYTYDGDQNVKSLVTVTPTGEVLVDYKYAYDLNGNRLNKVGSKHQVYYSYDKMNRLTASSYDGRQENFTYDKVGNRLTKTTNGVTEKYCYNVKNQLQELHQTSGITYFTYSPQGNTIKEESPTETNNYTYNSFNQQVKAQMHNGDTLISRYDAEGLRHEIEENERLVKFIFHKENVLVETDSEDHCISRFARGYEIVGAEIRGSDNSYNTYYYHPDEQGSTLYITDEEASTKNSYFYDAFGNVLKSEELVHNRITYVGQQFDGITQQYYLRARYYNPVIGRFTQEDSYRGDGLNLYAYCENNPIIYYDPSGYRKNLEPRKNIVSMVVDKDGNKHYELRYKDKYLKDGRKTETFKMTYDKNNQALFKKHKEYLYNNGKKGSKVQLPNGFSENRQKDFREANKINKKNGVLSQPKGYTWEHDRDKKTLYLVQTDVHDSSPHTGGHSKAKNNSSSKDSKKKHNTCKGKSKVMR